MVSTTKNAWIQNSYPQARRSDHIDTYNSQSSGHVSVHDPYNWLEHDGDEKNRWISEQQQLTRNYLDACSDRKKLEDAIRSSANYPKCSAPYLEADSRWYWLYNSGLQAQHVLYRSKDSKFPDLSDPGAGDVFFDPNLLSEDGTVSLAETEFSRDGKYLAYGISRSGSDFSTIYVRSTDAPLAHTGESDSPRFSHDDERLLDEIRFVKFAQISWTHDNKGFFYQRYPSRESHGSAEEDKAGTETMADTHAELYYHMIGTLQSEDIIIMKDPENPKWMWAACVAELDDRYVYLYIFRDTSQKCQIWVADLHETEIGPNMRWIKVISEFVDNYSVIANDSTLHYLITDKNAPKKKIVTIDIVDPNFEQKVLVPEDPDATLKSALVVNDKYLVLVYTKDVKDEIYIHSLVDGSRMKRVAPDFVGTIDIKSSRDKPWFMATLSGFTNPGIIAQYSFGTNATMEDSWQIRRTTEVNGLSLTDFVSEQVWYESADGTKIPMFIVRHKSTPLDGTAPAFQYGYGGFSYSVNPFFSPSCLVFIHKYGAILAVPNIRGGGEFGEDWHLAGTKERKVNCFDDFIAASQYLAKNKYAAADKITISGGSNGGLLVAACLNRAPSGTFGAAVAEVGVLDLLKFSQFTIGGAWTSDYGDPQDSHDFDFIYPISPLHNVPTDKIFPSTILFTADHDDRVVPLHSFKHAATLQYKLPSNPHPLLIRIEEKAGHGAGRSTEKMILASADKFAFIARSLGLEWKD